MSHKFQRTYLLISAKPPESFHPSTRISIARGLLRLLARIVLTLSVFSSSGLGDGCLIGNPADRGTAISIVTLRVPYAQLGSGSPIPNTWSLYSEVRWCTNFELCMCNAPTCLRPGTQLQWLAEMIHMSETDRPETSCQHPKGTTTLHAGADTWGSSVSKMRCKR
jgi:hypothetical protein